MSGHLRDYQPDREGCGEMTWRNRARGPRPSGAFHLQTDDLEETRMRVVVDRETGEQVPCAVCGRMGRGGQSVQLWFGAPLHVACRPDATRTAAEGEERTP